VAKFEGVQISRQNDFGFISLRGKMRLLISMFSYISVPAVLFLTCFVLTLTPAGTAQVTIHVPADQPTIQQGISAANSGDTVLVAPGIYKENINFQGKAITVTSSGGAGQTVIDGQRNGSSVVTFSSGEGNSSLLSGFTIQNGNGSEGGGITVQASSPKITNNTITNNGGCDGLGIGVGFGSPVIQKNLISNNVRSGCSGGIGGGGISIRGASSPQIIENTIENNSLDADGAGISLFAAGTPLIRGNTIRGNTTGANGGGIVMGNQSDADITGNIITNNTASSGGGIYWLVPSGARGPFVVNNTIVANNATLSGSEIFADGFDAQAQVVNNLIIGRAGQTAFFCGNFNDLNPPVIRFNDVFNPSGTAYGGVCTDQTGVAGNISSDPLFVNSAGGDLHLQAGSPAIDAGDNNSPNLAPKDFDGSSRVIDGNGDCVASVDIGAYERFGATALVLSSGSLAFGSQPINNASVSQTITLTNSGSTPSHMCGIASAGDFSETHTCGTLLGAGASCAIHVTFTPKAMGSTGASLTITNDAANAPQVIALSGTGVDFGMAISPASVTVNRGQVANYTITVTAQGGPFPNSVTFGCSGAPAQAMCQITPGAVSPGSASVNATLTISTIAPSQSSISILAWLTGRPIFALCLPLFGFALMGRSLRGKRSDKSRFVRCGILLAVFGVLLQFACGGGGQRITTSGTPTGTYDLNVTGTFGTTEHSSTVKLVVI
jgi:parallel beta-helix repeat protein